MNRVRKKNTPKSPVAMHSMISKAPALSRSASTRIGSSGCELRISISTNETRSTMKPRIHGVQTP